VIRVGRIGAALVLLAMLSSCAVGPKYQPPPTPAGAQAPLVSLTPAAETSADAPDDWWRLYHDSVLDQLLQEAFAANDNLKIAEANLSAARALFEAAKAGR
jgi:outer membrane protein TolC